MQQNSVHFFILTVGHKNVRLFEGSHKFLHLVNMDGFPADMESSLGLDEYPSERSVHTVMRAGRKTGVSSGQYSVPNTDKVMLKEFFRRIDDKIHDFMMKHKYPLILAGVDYVQAIYRSINSYPYLVVQGISGNHDRTSDKDLHVRARTILHHSSHKS